MRVTKILDEERYAFPFKIEEGRFRGETISKKGIEFFTTATEATDEELRSLIVFVDFSTRPGERLIEFAWDRKCGLWDSPTLVIENITVPDTFFEQRWSSMGNNTKSTLLRHRNPTRTWMISHWDRLDDGLRMDAIYNCNLDERFCRDRWNRMGPKARLATIIEYQNWTFCRDRWSELTASEKKIVMERVSVPNTYILVNWDSFSKSLKHLAVRHHMSRGIAKRIVTEWSGFGRRTRSAFRTAGGMKYLSKKELLAIQGIEEEEDRIFQEAQPWKIPVTEKIQEYFVDELKRHHDEALAEVSAWDIEMSVHDLHYVHQEEYFWCIWSVRYKYMCDYKNEYSREKDKYIRVPVAPHESRISSGGVLREELNDVNSQWIKAVSFRMEE